VSGHGHIGPFHSSMRLTEELGHRLPRVLGGTEGEWFSGFGQKREELIPNTLSKLKTATTGIRFGVEESVFGNCTPQICGKICPCANALSSAPPRLSHTEISMLIVSYDVFVQAFLGAA